MTKSPLILARATARLMGLFGSDTKVRGLNVGQIVLVDQTDEKARGLLASGLLTPIDWDGQDDPPADAE